MRDENSGTLGGVPLADLPILVVAGPHSGVGKTAWVEALTRDLSERGLAVAVIKHHGHAVTADADESGTSLGETRRLKDTQRARQAGAVERILVSERSLQWDGRLRAGSGDSLRFAVSLLDWARRGGGCSPVDLVLAEGFRAVRDAPRLWVADANGPPPTHVEDEGPSESGPRFGAAPELRLTGAEASDPNAVARVRTWLRHLGFPIERADGARPG